MLQLVSPSVLLTQLPMGCAVRKVIQIILTQKKNLTSASLLDWGYLQSSGFPHRQGRDRTALLLSWKWMAGSRQKLIKLALAKDMNCGITPQIASNPISLAQLVTRSWDEFQPAMKHSSWTFTRKSIHWTWEILTQVLLGFYERPNFPNIFH